jgi:hypothetical protein
MPKPFYEPGNYVAEVLQQALGENENTGTSQLVLQVKILGKPDPADPESYMATQQYTRTIYCYITPKTIDYFIENLKTLGFQGSSFSELDPSSPNFQSFAGRQIEVYCQHETNTRSGELHEKWGISSGSKSIEIKPLTTKKTRELDMLFGKNLRALKAEQSQSKPAPAPAPGAAPPQDWGVITDDDVPY